MTLSGLLPKYGVRRAILSPGSRNTPLIIAISRNADMETRIVIDERSAAFVGLGMCAALGEPVALVCTSGTAPLNYSPAVAEAYYRNLPLVVITADRPRDRIDLLDSQTIRQPGIYNNYVKGSFDLNGLPPQAAARIMCDALITATSGRPGPVHINVPLDNPLGETAETDFPPEKMPYIKYVEAAPGKINMELPQGCRRVMVVAGFMRPDRAVQAQLARLAARPGVVVVAEHQANAAGIAAADAVFSLAEKLPAPEVLVTVGGSVTSGVMKKYLASVGGLHHISLGQGLPAADTYGSLAQIYDCDAAQGLEALEAALDAAGDTEYSRAWKEAATRCSVEASRFIDDAGWSALKAMKILSHALELSYPMGYALHLSNGMTVRYAQFVSFFNASDVSCNRGVSGIDGCTSTAIGAAMARPDMPVVLISGDMSAQYDMGALAIDGIPRGFKMVVLSNGGGNIFRHIATTRGLDELERCFATKLNFPAADVARTMGWQSYRATCADELQEVMGDFISDNTAPALLEIVTDGPADAAQYRKLFKFITENVKI